ncbi:hypothetical protein NDU88_008961 [Pleurodeles waltl]|uniref:Uncharacterized protein n=1 Tax=Pleurodeles waltl TaxID=8319 RepID=A0AAV7QW88_PLEWA|nr:hypothetical protein NDU88_008961 [Pleurodeles waltl]
MTLWFLMSREREEDAPPISVPGPTEEDPGALVSGAHPEAPLTSGQSRREKRRQGRKTWRGRRRNGRRDKGKRTQRRMRQRSSKDGREKMWRRRRQRYRRTEGEETQGWRWTGQRIPGMPQTQDGRAAKPQTTAISPAMSQEGHGLPRYVARAGTGDPRELEKREGRDR